MWLPILFVMLSISITVGVVVAIIKREKKPNARKAFEENALQIISLYNKNNPKKRVYSDSSWSVVSIVGSTNKCGFVEFFNAYNPDKFENWCEEDIERFKASLCAYQRCKDAYNMQLFGFIPTIQTTSSLADQQRITEIAASTSMKKPKSAAGTMVKGAVVGKLIGGDAGAVVGAMVAKEKHDSKNK